MDYLTDASNEVQTYFTTHHIPTYFYQCLFGELVKIFGINLVLYCDTGDSHKDQIDEHLTLLAGSGGWNTAFIEACDQCGLTDMYKYYLELDWVRSDIFDGVIVDNMINVLFDDKVGYDYYNFKFQKENKQ
jgi:hypothetical protein